MAIGSNILKNIRGYLSVGILLMLTSYGTAYAQDGVITLTDVSLPAAKLIEAIQQQTDYKLSYAGNTIVADKLIRLPSLKVTVKDAVKLIASASDAKFVIYRKYIAFVPVVTPECLQRTADSYIPVPIASNDASLVVRASDSTVVPVLSQPVLSDACLFKRATVPPILYSDYRPASSYGSLSGRLPRFALKTNLLYSALAFTPNLGIEFGLSPHSSLELSGSYNAFKRKKSSLDDKKQLMHRSIRLEYRYWFCERYSRHFVGTHVFFTQYNISGHKLPLLFKKDNRYDGDAYGVGFTYGYDLNLAKKWGLEFNVGVGMAYLKYDRFGCEICDRISERKDKFYFGPTRAGVTLVFLLK